MELDKKLAKKLDEAYAILKEIDERLNELGFNVDSTVLDRAMDIFRDAYEKKFTIGRYTGAIVAASLYYAAREAGYVLPFASVSDAARVGKRDVASCYRHLIKKVKVPNLALADIVESAAKKLRISKDEKKIAVKILKRALERDVRLKARYPFALVAAALYMACLICGRRKTQRELAEALYVSEVAIRSNLSELKNLLAVEVHV